MNAYKDRGPRTRQVNLRVNQAEEARLRELSEHYGVHPSEVLRMLVKREHDKLATRLTKPLDPSTAQTIAKAPGTAESAESSTEPRESAGGYTDREDC